MILSTIDFPWPVAAIILQHHECVDGSGYPLGLEGSMMLTESKVVCVADVVEAMSTHRPYRPALGIEAAIEEINKFKGIRFDADVVDACTELYYNGDIDFNHFIISRENKGKRFF
jgi:HD-GYP domain-containing protein (c-di-GMP phosphodiesterase class II)